MTREELEGAKARADYGRGMAQAWRNSGPAPGFDVPGILGDLSADIRGLVAEVEWLEKEFVNIDSLEHYTADHECPCCLKQSCKDFRQYLRMLLDDCRPTRIGK